MLIAILMLAACASGVLTVWDNLFRYQAYGVVSGRTIEIASPMEGILTSLHVREGDVVRQGAVLATISDLQSEQKLARLADELRVAEASLHAEIAKIQWQSHLEESELLRAVSDFHETEGQIHQQVGALDILRDQLDRTQTEYDAGVATTSTLTHRLFSERSGTQALGALQQSLLRLRERAAKADRAPRLGTEQIQPFVAKSSMLLNELARMRQWIDQGRLTAPVNGTILRRYCPSGERVDARQPVFTVLEESSTEIELFVTQEIAHDFHEGDTIRLNIEPFDSLVPCVVVAIGTEHRTPPEQIEIFYRSHAKLLPIRLRPIDISPDDPRLKVGAVARLPYLRARG